MNIKRLLLLLIAFYPLSLAFCQRVNFLYDDNGNRTSRTISIEQLRSESLSFPVINSKNLRTVDNIQGSASHDLTIGENSDKESIKSNPPESEIIKTNIFPNPTSGILKIQVDNMPLNVSTEAQVYDLSGNILIIRKDLGPLSELDLNKLKEGIYILRIRIDTKWYDWKVVINH